MDNWCIGDLKVKGKYKDIKQFLSNELIIIDGDVNKNPKITEFGYQSHISVENKALCFKRNTKIYFSNNIDIYFSLKKNEEKDNMVIIAELGELYSAWDYSLWDLDAKMLTQLSKEYNLDFQIYTYEIGSEFHIDFEVHKGKIIKNQKIKYDAGALIKR